jgi:probable phosphoglycerate mutase
MINTYNKQRVFLVRHGETEWSRSGRHTGRTDIPLTDAGREAARRLAPILQREQFQLVLASPLDRARETSALAGFNDVSTEQDLYEWDYGSYEGKTAEEIRELAPGWLLFRDGCPGGETPDQIWDRADRVIARVRKVPGDVVLFAHGHILRAIGARWIGLAVVDGSRFRLDTATLCVLSYYHGLPAVERWNDSVNN